MRASPGTRRAPERARLWGVCVRIHDSLSDRVFGETNTPSRLTSGTGHSNYAPQAHKTLSERHYGLSPAFFDFVNPAHHQIFPLALQLAGEHFGAGDDFGERYFGGEDRIAEFTGALGVVAE